MTQILLLSSGKFMAANELDFFEKPIQEYKLAHITTASKGRGVASLDHLDRARNNFKAKNIRYEDVDIDGMTEQDLRERLKGFNGVFVNGGSSFYLLKAVRESGFERIIKELLGVGFLYIGASAGSYVACPTIEMSTWRHQDTYDHYGMTDLTAMNLVPFLVTVHYKPENEAVISEGMKQTKYEVKILADDQAIFVKDDQVTQLGPPEIKLP